ncbi:MAG: tetratricopeptide repeat protein [Bacteroidota bacterium]
MKVLCLMLMMITGFTLTLLSQDKTIETDSLDIDQLYDLLEKAQKDNDAYRQTVFLLELGMRNYQTDDLKASYEYYSRALDLATNNNFYKFKGQALNDLGLIYSVWGAYEKAIIYIQRSTNIDVQLNNEEGIAIGYSNIGNIYESMGKYDLALDYYRKALEIDQKYNNREGIFYDYNNMGIIYDYIGQWENALDFYEEALKIANEIDYKEGIASSFNNIGNLYIQRQDFVKALGYCEKSLMVEKEIGNKHGIAISYSNIGLVYQETGDFETALEYQFKALEMVEELYSVQSMIFCYRNIGGIYNELGDVEKAIEYLQKSLDIAISAGHREKIMNGYHTLGEIYFKTGDYDRALTNMKLFSVYSDSLFNDEIYNMSSDLKNRYENEKKEKEIEILKKEKELSSKELNTRRLANERQGILIILMLSGFILIFVLGIIIARMSRLKRKANHLLNELNDHIKLQSEEIAAQRDEIQVQKEELEVQRNLATQQRDTIQLQKQEITDSIRYANRIQKAMYPGAHMFNEVFSGWFIMNIPKNIVSGDFYWLSLSEKYTVLVTGDCTGHGISGSFLGMLANAYLNEYAGITDVPVAEKIIRDLRDYIRNTLHYRHGEDEFSDNIDLCTCVFNREEKMLSLAAINVYPFLLKENECLAIEPARSMTHLDNDGKAEIIPYIVKAGNGEIIYITSDGLLNQFGGAGGRKLMKKGFMNMAIEAAKMDINRQKDYFRTEFEKWKGEHQQIDDILLIGVEF